MPLRVTDEYSIGGEDCQRVHRKMSKQGHFQKIRRPTGLEVYNDAAKILEELLEKRIDHNLKSRARQRRNKTDPTKNNVNEVVRNGCDVTVARCKTMPSRYRESIDDDAKKKELEDIDKKEQWKKLNKGIPVETDSSANDTELESDAEDRNVVTKNRKKKSLFKRAKENLIRTFQRDQKSGFGERDKTDKTESSSVQKRKRKKKESSVVTESQRSVKGHLNKDKSIDFVETVEYREASKKDINIRKSRTGSISRGSLIDAIRKPFRKTLHHKDNLDDDEKNKLIAHSIPRKPSNLPYEEAIPNVPTPRPVRIVCQGWSPPTDPSSPKRSPSNLDSLPYLATGLQGGTLSSTTSTTYPNSSEHHNSVGSLSVLPSPGCSVLDSPGDDIQYIDVIEDDMEKRKSLIKYHGSEGLLNLQWLAEQTAHAKAFDFKIDERSVSTIRSDGQLETTTTVTATRTVLSELDVVEESGHDEQDGNEQSGEDAGPAKDEIYGKIALKLIEMADTYSATMSDNEGRGAATDIAAIDDAPLTDLEKEIIACLRSGGDKYGKQMEDQLDAMKTAVTDEGYDRFRSTVENSMGHELSWNTLALLFYATKGVVSAVGKSSKVAVQAKEFTLKYISDTFVSWIMEQGGFDSMLSGSESDPELD